MENSRIYVAGHTGLVGTALTKALLQGGYDDLIQKSHKELDLTDTNAVDKFFGMYKPEYVFMAAAKVGGIIANSTYPADFIYQNIMIETNIIHSAYKHSVKKLLFFGSSCIYPKNSIQPIKEDYLFTGPLEPTNEAYATAKIAGLNMCRAYNMQHSTDFISIVPCTIYGPGDNFDINSSHVVSAMIKKFHESKLNGAPQVELWGDGTPIREFLYVDDLADAAIFLMNSYSSNEFINVGTGKGVSIKQLAELIKRIVDYKGQIKWNTDKPNGMPKKLLNIERLQSTGWRHKVKLEDGIVKTYEWYMKNL